MERNLKNIINKSTEKLEKSGSQTPRLDAELLLAFVMKKDRTYLFMYPEKILDQDIENAFEQCLNKRINGIPLQYIVGKQEFMGLDFKVNENVLIPRADTEILIEKTLESIKEKTTPIHILDIGSGSGAIGISLAYYSPNAIVSCVDISSKALKVAKDNAVTHSVHNRITFYEGDLFSPVKERCFDMIVSNPPYIPDKTIEGLQVEVAQYEPWIALAGGADGLNFYRRIIKDAPHYLKENGQLYLEIGHDQAKDVTSLLISEKVYDGIEVIQDLGGHDRVVKAVRNPR